MSKRRKILLLLTGLVLALGVFMPFRESEPSYAGRTLSEWLVRLIRYSGSQTQIDPEAAEAIRHIGGKAVPFLVRWVGHDASTWRQDLARCCDRHKSLEWLAAFIDGPSARAFGASEAFAFVGPEGKTAIPGLARLLDKSNGQRAYRAAYSLGKLGPDALPPLLAGLTNKSPEAREGCVRAIRNIGTNAIAALPALRKVFHDPDIGVRTVATNAVRSIAPQALTNTPPQAP
jgi:hypothetical protein